MTVQRSPAGRHTILLPPPSGPLSSFPCSPASLFSIGTGTREGRKKGSPSCARPSSRSASAISLILNSHLDSHAHQSTRPFSEPHRWLALPPGPHRPATESGRRRWVSTPRSSFVLAPVQVLPYSWLCHPLFSSFFPHESVDRSIAGRPTVPRSASAGK